MKLIIGNKNYSSWSLRPWLLLAAKGIEFEEIRIPLYQPDTRSVLAGYSDAGKVPVLHDGDIVVWDSLAICEYVSEQYLAGGGWPESAAARAEARSCSAEMHSGFFEVRDKLPMNCRASRRRVPATPSLLRDIDRVVGLWSDLRSRYAAQGPWLFGTFSIADCMFAPVVSRFDTYGIGVPERCAAYMTLVLDTEPMQRWYRDSREETEIIEASETGS